MRLVLFDCDGTLVDSAKLIHEVMARTFVDFGQARPDVSETKAIIGLTLDIAIARIASNPLYDYVLHSVHDNIQRYYDKFLAPGEQEMEENFQDLRLIIEAIAAHQPEQASGLARAHIRRFSAYMKGKRRSTAAQSRKINRPNDIQ